MNLNKKTPKFHNPNSYQCPGMSRFRVYPQSPDDDAATGVVDDTALPANGQEEDVDDSATGDAGKRAIDKMKADRNAARAQAEKLAQQLEQYKDVDLKELEDLRNAKKQKELNDLADKQEYSLSLAKMKTEMEQRESALHQQKAQLELKLENQLIGTEVTEAFFENGGKRGPAGQGPGAFAKMLMPQIRDRLAVIDGVVCVVDSDGEQEFNVKTGKITTLGDLMVECRSGAMGVLFESTDKAGGGGATGNRSALRQTEEARIRAIPDPSARLAAALAAGIQ